MSEGKDSVGKITTAWKKINELLKHVYSIHSKLRTNTQEIMRKVEKALIEMAKINEEKPPTKEEQSQATQ